MIEVLYNNRCLVINPLVMRPYGYNMISEDDNVQAKMSKIENIDEILKGNPNDLFAFSGAKVYRLRRKKEVESILPALVKMASTIRAEGTWDMDPDAALMEKSPKFCHFDNSYGGIEIEVFYNKHFVVPVILKQSSETFGRGHIVSNYLSLRSYDCIEVQEGTLYIHGQSDREDMGLGIHMHCSRDAANWVNKLSKTCELRSLPPIAKEVLETQYLTNDTFTRIIL